MAQPAVPEVPQDLLRVLLDGLLAFRQAEPWRWMGDAAASVYEDDAGQPWFACVLGAGRQVYGLCLYRGTAGLRLFRELHRQGAAYDYSQLCYQQDAVTVWFGPKSELDEVQIGRYRMLGYAPKRGDRLAWPDVRSHRPGLFPWHPDEKEVRVLAEVLPRVIRLAELVRHQPECFDEHDENEMPILPTLGTMLTLDTLEWRLWLTPKEGEIAAAVVVDEQGALFRQALGLPKTENTGLEIDVIFMPEPVSGGERPYYPRCVLVFRSEDGFCCAMNLLKPDQDAAAEAGALLLKTVSELKCRPAKLLVCRKELVVRLAPLATRLGIELKEVPRLNAAEGFCAGMANLSR